MPINEKYIEAFEENQFFHIYCKSVGNTFLFKNDDNRRFFLKKFAQYSNGYFYTYAYILLDNHVHWLIKCTSHNNLVNHIENIPLENRKIHQKKFINNEINFEEAMEYQFKDFFISYAMAYNKKNNRIGALFINPFRRIKVNNDSHFTQLVIYIHANVVKHKLQKKFQQYIWSSYQSFLINKPTLLIKEEVLDWFGGKEKFIELHQSLVAYYYEHAMSIE